jgi:hypothetical protein
MGPRRQQPKAPEPRPEEKRKRFRIVKLEERIAPHHTKPTKGGFSQNCSSTVSIE